MQGICWAATRIVDDVQPRINGGLFANLLENAVHLSSSESVISTAPTQITNTVVHHILSTFASTGYALAITFALLWYVLLIIIGICVCRSARNKSRRNRLPVELTANNASVEAGVIRERPLNSNVYRSFHRNRERLQASLWCLSVQFISVVLLAVLLATGILLGLSASSHLHANLAAPPVFEEKTGRLLTPMELNTTYTPVNQIFPLQLRSLAQIRAYLSTFVENTKMSTAATVDELIAATERMQDRMTLQFNDMLFDEIGVSRAFQLGDELGRNVIPLIKHSMGIVERDLEFKAEFDKLKLAMQNWLRQVLINSPSEDDVNCSAECQLLRATFVANLTTRPDTFMPTFTFAIALKFVTTDQNQTADSMQKQLNQGRLFADRQLKETKLVMAKRINIPASISAMVNQQWDLLGEKLEKAIEQVDDLAGSIRRSLLPKVTLASGVTLASSCLFWISLMILTLGLFWLIIHYHCVSNALSPRGRKTMRRAAGCGFFLLSLSILVAMTFFLTGGYLYTEVCRYLEPHQEPSSMVGNHSMFPLDAYINLFIERNQDVIAKLAAESAPKDAGKQLSIPKIRNPLHAVFHGCREDKGILDSLDAIRDFDMSTLNDPNMSNKFITIGLEIMMDSLRAINISELFPEDTDKQLGMASRLDDFIIDFDKLRKQLPSHYLSVRLSGDDSSNYALFTTEQMWNAWEVYGGKFLQPRMTSDTGKERLYVATEKVRAILLKLDAILDSIRGHLIELSKAKMPSPLVHDLQKTVVQIKEILSNRPLLLDRAQKLFRENVEAKTPEEAAKLITLFGPKLMAEVGRCRRLYDAATDMNLAFCDGTVKVLNGIWFSAGWVTLVGMLAIIFGLLLLLHKSSEDESVKTSLLKQTATKVDALDSISGNHPGDQNLASPLAHRMPSKDAEVNPGISMD